MRRTSLALVGALLSLALTAPAQAAAPELIEDPLPPPPLSSTTVAVETLAEGFTSPVNSAVAPGDPHGIYIVDQVGPLWRVDRRDGSKRLIADLSRLIVPLGVNIPHSEAYDERGFLGLVFHPDFRHNGLVYTHTSEPADSGEPTFPSTMPPGERPDHLSVLREWNARTAADRLGGHVNPAKSRVLFRIAHPQFNHNAGEMVFGPDGMLYFNMGDGGGADDQNGQLYWIDPDGDGNYELGPIMGHPFGGNAQNLAVPLGKILRIDVDGRNSRNGEYGIPEDNPFIDVPGALDEIWAYGFRNPFAGSIDPATGDYWVGDAGQNDVEEIDKVIRGGNYGWNVREGGFFFAPRGFEQHSGTVVTEPVQPVPPVLIEPVAQYDHGYGVVVIGGYVHRGRTNPALRGRYLFGDHEGGKLLNLDADGVVRQLRIAGHPENELGYELTSFARDAFGELYAMGTAHGIVEGNEGRIERIRPASSDVRPCTIVGTPGPDLLTGTRGSDVICADEGDDILVGLRGNDRLYGGDGDDILVGGSGDDYLHGGAGSDEIVGAGGGDEVVDDDSDSGD